MFEVKVPELGEKFQFGKKLVRVFALYGDREFCHVTYEENISVENGCVTFIDIDNKVHKLINVPVVIDYGITSPYASNGWRNWKVTDYEREQQNAEFSSLLSKDTTDK